MISVPVASHSLVKGFLMSPLTDALTFRPVLILLGRLVGNALHLHRSRRQLGQLAPHLLRDIGLTPEQAHSEAIRPVWDAAEHWRQPE